MEIDGLPSVDCKEANQTVIKSPTATLMIASLRASRANITVGSIFAQSIRQAEIWRLGKELTYEVVVYGVCLKFIQKELNEVVCEHTKFHTLVNSGAPPGSLRCKFLQCHRGRLAGWSGSAEDLP